MNLLFEPSHTNFAPRFSFIRVIRRFGLFSRTQVWESPTPGPWSAASWPRRTSRYPRATTDPPGGRVQGSHGRTHAVSLSDPISLQFGFMCFEMMHSFHQHSIPPGTLMTNFRSFKDVILSFDQTPLSLSFSKLIHIFSISLVDALRHQKLAQSSICNKIGFMLCLLLYQDSHHPEVCPVLSFPLPCVPVFVLFRLLHFNSKSEPICNSKWSPSKWNGCHQRSLEMLLIRRRLCPTSTSPASAGARIYMSAPVDQSQELFVQAFYDLCIVLNDVILKCHCFRKNFVTVPLTGLF